jgi:hypothetical protein
MKVRHIKSGKIGEVVDRKTDECGNAMVRVKYDNGRRYWGLAKNYESLDDEAILVPEIEPDKDIWDARVSFKVPVPGVMKFFEELLPGVKLRMGGKRHFVLYQEDGLKLRSIGKVLKDGTFVATIHGKNLLSLFYDLSDFVSPPQPCQADPWIRDVLLPMVMSFYSGDTGIFRNRETGEIIAVKGIGRKCCFWPRRDWRTGKPEYVPWEQIELVDLIGGVQ